MEKGKKKLRFSIRWKAVTMIVALSVVVMEIAVAYFAIIVNKLNRETYMNITKDIAASAAKVVDVDAFNEVKGKVKTVIDGSTKGYPNYEDNSEEEVEEYLTQFESLSEDASYVANFNKNLTILQDLQDANVDFVDCIYLTYIDKDRGLFVYLIDAAEEDACPAGLLDPVFEFNQYIYDHPKDGFKPYITDTSMYGWLITAGSPIFEADGETVAGYAMADVSMYTVRKSQATAIVKMFLYMLATIVLIVALGVVWVSLWMINPLKKVKNLAESYDGSDPKGTHERFESFKNKSADEIDDLTESIKTMEKDVYDRFNALVDTNRQLLVSKEETKKMSILANQDGLTGVHNKISYNSEVERIEKQIADKEEVEFAIVMVDLNYLKDINDVFGHDDGDMAIIKTCSLVCEIFSLSPVYRIGGDEFVAICRGKDYAKISQLVSTFKKRIAEISGGSEIHDSKHISAAIGYSLFDKKSDKCVNDVFKRADKAMYENKREMKNAK